MTTAGEPLGTADRRGPAIGDDAARDAVARARAEELALVRFLYVDHGGIVRGKAVSADRLPERMVSGIGHTVAMMAMSMLDDLRPADGMGPVGEVRIVPDPATFVSLPYAPGAGAMLADLVRPDGQPWDACARTFLKQAIAALAADGYGLNAAFEPEFTLGRRQASRTAGQTGWFRSMTACATQRPAPISRTTTPWSCLGALQAQGLRVEHYYPELGHGQQEMSIGHAPALRAADNHVLYRESVRGIAFRRGLWASLAPKPIPDQAGNGTHLHGSLTDLNSDGSPGAQPVPRGRPVRAVRARLSLHRRPARPSARPDRTDLRQREQLPAAGAAVLEQRLHHLRDG
jgi:glutamine synthetase